MLHSKHMFAETCRGRVDSTLGTNVWKRLLHFAPSTSQQRRTSPTRQATLAFDFSSLNFGTCRPGGSSSFDLTCSEMAQDTLKIKIHTGAVRHIRFSPSSDATDLKMI